MVKKQLYPLFMCCMLIVISACRHDDSPEVEIPKDNTVLLYMPWTGNESNSNKDDTLYTFFMKNIAGVEQAITEQKGLGTTRVLVYIASSPSQSALVDITYKNNKCVRDTLKKYSSLDVATEDGIRTVLDDVQTVSPTPTYSMIVGAHATGWMPRGSAPWYASSAKVPHKAFGGSSAKTQTDITTLANAIKTSAIGKLQYICFDCCYMSNIETAYALRNTADYLIASTSEIMDYGMPYAMIWKHLVATPNYNAVCNEFLDFYTSYKDPYGTITAVNCSQVEPLIPMMRTFNTLYEATDEELEEVQPLDGFDSTVFYDLMDYVEHVSKDPSLTESIRTQLNNIVIATVATPRVFSYYIKMTNKHYAGDKTYYVNNSCGLTISDPSTNSDAITSKTQTEWWKATHNPQ